MLPRLKQAAPKYRTTSAMPDQCASHYLKETGISEDQAFLVRCRQLQQNLVGMWAT